MWSVKLNIYLNNQITCIIVALVRFVHAKFNCLSLKGNEKYSNITASKFFTSYFFYVSFSLFSSRKLFNLFIVSQKVIWKLTQCSFIIPLQELLTENVFLRNLKCSITYHYSSTFLESYLWFFPPFTKEHIPEIVTPVHMARFRTSRLRSSLIALKI